MIRREIWRQEKLKGFLEFENIRKMWTAQACERVRCPRFKNAFVEHLGVSDVDFDPENGSRMAQVAKSEIFNQSFV